MKIFGIKSIIVNHTVIHTYNVMINKTEENARLAKTSGLDFNTAYTIKGERIQLTFTSISVKEFDDKVHMLGHLLRAVALNNLNKKYNWVK
jgi:hypothetical protein